MTAPTLTQRRFTYGTGSRADSVRSISPVFLDDEDGVYPEDLLRRKLKYFFMNPCEKWRAKKKFPWKLVLQVIKIVFVTIQLVMFGTSRASHVDFLEKSSISFKHLFLLNWTSSLETMPYPPASGTFAIYTWDQFYESVDFAMSQYNQTENIAMGTYQFHRPNNNTQLPPMKMCNSHFKLGHNWSRNQSYKFDAKEVTKCFEVSHEWVTDNKTEHIGVKEYLRRTNNTINFDGVNMITLHFELTAIHLRYLSRLNPPDCYIFNILIRYDNREHDGQMKVSLANEERSLPCFGEIHYEGGEFSFSLLSSIFDSVVILVSLVSFFLCVRSIFRAQKLKRHTVRFFEIKLHKPLSRSDRLEFINLWYVLIIINDALTVSGSILKLSIENKVVRHYEACGILLGTGSLLVWFGVLRYLGFFEKYNILILTMKNSAPSILRFLVCAGVFYFGFAICGWVVLGPYHLKFRHLGSSSECLFSLVNGDDMYVTFAAIKNSSYIWWYSRVYLYIFISLFIYVILSLFISIILDTYETIKKYYEHGFPKSELQRFIEQCTDDANALFRSYSNSNFNRPGDETGHERSGCAALCGCLPIPPCSTCCDQQQEDDSGQDERHSLLT